MVIYWLSSLDFVMFYIILPCIRGARSNYAYHQVWVWVVRQRQAGPVIVSRCRAQPPATAVAATRSSRLSPNAPIVLWGRRYIMALHTPARRTLSPASAKMVLDAVAHALPGALKWTAIVLVLLNVRSFPFAWHCECLLRVCCVDIQY
jgi:hypothetical protein